MNEIDSLRQEAETLKNAIRVSITWFLVPIQMVTSLPSRKNL